MCTPTCAHTFAFDYRGVELNENTNFKFLKQHETLSCSDCVAMHT